MEQIIIVLRMAVDRLDPAEQDVQVDLGDLMSMLAQYTSRLGRDEIGLRIKILSTCRSHLVESGLCYPAQRGNSQEHHSGLSDRMVHRGPACEAVDFSKVLKLTYRMPKHPDTRWSRR